MFADLPRVIDFAKWGDGTRVADTKHKALRMPKKVVYSNLFHATVLSHCMKQIA